jgi:hypothetical protein
MAGAKAGRSSTGGNNLTEGEKLMLNRALKGAAALAIVGLVIGGAEAQQKTYSIGTGGTGGVYYPLGGAVANVLSKHLPGVQATAEVTGGSVDNLKLIGSGQSERSMPSSGSAAFRRRRSPTSAPLRASRSSSSTTAISPRR